MLTSRALGIPLPTSEEAEATTVVSSEADFQTSSDPTPTALYLHEAKHLYDGILKGDFSWSAADSSDSLKEISRVIQSKRLELQKKLAYCQIVASMS